MPGDRWRVVGPRRIPEGALRIGNVAIGGLGAAIALIAAVDLFLTVFNYDGFTSLAAPYQRMCWSLLRLATAPLPGDARHTARSLSSATLLPLTVALWLGLEITGFALIYSTGLSLGGLQGQHITQPGMGTAFYFSAGNISTLTFGDVLPQSGLYRALVDLEAIVGLATFTLSLGYVVTAFSVFGDLNSLHNVVRRHAADPQRPSSLLARHFRGGQPAELSALLQTLSERPESYDQGLRRYPVVFYFHTRRLSRSTPAVFSVLADLLAQLRWGLPADSDVVEGPWLAALLDQYGTTLRRLQRSFVGPVQLPPAPVVDPSTFARSYADGAADSAGAFRAMQDRSRSATGLAPAPDADVDAEALADAQDAAAASSALANVEESLRRADFMFYSAKRWDEDQYLAEVARLMAIRDELAQDLTPSLPPLDFTGVFDAWEGGDPQTRRQLLGQLFDALDVEDREVVSYLPRSDRTAEVVGLMERLVGAEREGFEPPRA